ncbi:MAG: nucleotidyltransferase domain-containing protein [Sulfurimonas sp.]|jgi:hypothetical protein
MLKEEILHYLKLHQDEFKSKYQISKMALFGSYARGENREDSDVDIAIETQLSDYFVLYDFKETLENRFHTKVDVIRLRDKMNLSLKNRILREAIYV